MWTRPLQSSLRFLKNHPVGTQNKPFCNISTLFVTKVISYFGVVDQCLLSTFLLHVLVRAPQVLLIHHVTLGSYVHLITMVTRGCQVMLPW